MQLNRAISQHDEGAAIRGRLHEAHCTALPQKLHAAATLDEARNSLCISAELMQVSDFQARGQDDLVNALASHAEDTASSSKQIPSEEFVELRKAEFAEVRQTSDTLEPARKFPTDVVCSHAEEVVDDPRVMAVVTTQSSDEMARDVRRDEAGEVEKHGISDELTVISHSTTPVLAKLTGPELALIVARLPLAEVLAVRATSVMGVEWSMHRAVSGLEELKKVHDRIRARLWIQRVADLTKDTDDETVFESQVRTLANNALRRRMEGEMIEAKLHMERQIHLFQGEVDRRMEEQALRVHAIVEERVQQQFDAILVAEMEKVRTMVEERVQERVRTVVQSEVRATVCEVQSRLAALARENDCLRAAFIEHSDLCFRSLAWAHHTIFESFCVPTRFQADGISSLLSSNFQNQKPHLRNSNKNPNPTQSYAASFLINR
jgi:hypothetical protein